MCEFIGIKVCPPEAQSWPWLTATPAHLPLVKGRYLAGPEIKGRRNMLTTRRMAHGGCDEKRIGAIIQPQRVAGKLPLGSEASSDGLPQSPAKLRQTSDGEATEQVYTHAHFTLL